MAAVLPTYADETRIEEDIAELGTLNLVIQQKIKRANEDASSEMEALFLNNFDPSDPEPFFVQITTKYATALFWLKSNGTDAALNQVKQVYEEAQRILQQRFQPVESRVT